MSKVKCKNPLLAKPGSLLIFKNANTVEYGVYLGVVKEGVDDDYPENIYKCYWPTSGLEYTVEDETDLLEFRNQFVDEHG